VVGIAALAMRLGGGFAVAMTMLPVFVVFFLAFVANAVKKQEN
jgi:hypothetical protein